MVLLGVGLDLDFGDGFEGGNGPMRPTIFIDVLSLGGLIGVEGVLVIHNSFEEILVGDMFLLHLQEVPYQACSIL